MLDAILKELVAKETRLKDINIVIVSSCSPVLAASGSRHVTLRQSSLVLVPTPHPSGMPNSFDIRKDKKI